MPDSADVSHHPFQAEIDELVDAVRADRETHLNVFDAERTIASASPRIDRRRPAECRWRVHRIKET
jgi:hypothetical protein